MPSGGGQISCKICSKKFPSGQIPPSRICNLCAREMFLKKHLIGSESSLDQEELEQLGDMPKKVYAITLAGQLQFKDRVAVVGRVDSGATSFSVNFRLKNSKLLGYHMRSSLEGGAVTGVFHASGKPGRWETQDQSDPYALDGGQFELVYEFYYDKVRVLNGGNNIIHTFNLSLPMRDIEKLEVWAEVPNSVVIEEVRFSYSNGQDV